MTPKRNQKIKTSNGLIFQFKDLNKPELYETKYINFSDTIVITYFFNEKKFFVRIEKYEYENNEKFRTWWVAEVLNCIDFEKIKETIEEFINIVTK